MGAIDNFLIKAGLIKPRGTQPKKLPVQFKQPSMKADFLTNGFYRQVNGFSVSFDGEKNLGEIGPIKDYWMNYYALGLRGWQSYIENLVTHIITNRFKTWVIGKGLRLESQPKTNFLKTKGINIDKNEFSKWIEEVWNLYSGSTESSFSKMENLNKLQETAYVNAMLNGDVLVILRLSEDNTPTVQLIDGSNVVSPNTALGSETFPVTLPNGNKISFGIEYKPSGEHVAYYVRKNSFSFETERIPAIGEESGMVMAFMIYGLKMRIGSVRGVPMTTVVLETLKKMERYQEATVGSAEERQKIVYQIVHEMASDGSTPFAENFRKAISPDHNTDEIPEDVEGTALANKVQATTNKQTVNMGIGQKLEELKSENELNFKDFYMTLFQIICAAMEIPPDVAMSMYNGNYSSSRAALKDWEYILSVKRTDFSNQFNQRVYNFAFYVWTSISLISAPGFLKSFFAKDWMTIAAYTFCQWIGASVPHIDPMKEVQAARLKLGATGAAIPLTTVEQATQDVNGGDYHANVEQYAQELDQTKGLGIEMPQPQAGGGAPAQG